jgi:hypothetical protein
MSDLSGYCIYTMRHSSVLDAQANANGPHTLTEHKIWKTGHLLWTEAKRSGERMALLLSGAEADTGIIYWAYIDDITIDDLTGTTCTYSDLRPVTPRRKLSSLRLRSTGRPLSDDYIRPYAICRTPSFLA